MINYKIFKKLEKTDCLVIPLWEDKPMEREIKELDKRFFGLISNVLENKDFEGKKMQTSLLYTKDKEIPRLFLLGLGKQKDLNVRLWKKIIGSAVIACQGKKMQKLVFVFTETILKQLGIKKIAEETVVAVELANYSYDEHKTNKDKKIISLELFNFLLESNKYNKLFELGIEEGKIISSAVNFARHLGNTPPTIMTPTFLANEASKMSKENKKLKTTVLSQKEIEKLGMGCLLGVARGSEEEPKFIIVEYWGGNKKDRPSVFVGKGITFDSGGLNLKPGSYMTDMKFDMLGAATVLGILKSAAELGLKKNIIGLIPSAENMPGGTAYRPDDILTAMNGKTVEIKNTDAEGRLVLVDALCYAEKYQPKEVIDLATLTGACMVALGLERSGFFTAEEKISQKLLQASLTVGEQLWRLPLGEEFTEEMQSETADIQNDGKSRYGGASQGAAFLEFFTLDKEGQPAYPWAHIDLASAIHENKGKSFMRAGANGFGVETMVEYLRS